MATSIVSGGGSTAVVSTKGALSASTVSDGGAITTAGYQSYLWTEDATLPMWSEDSSFISEVVFTETATLPMWTEVSVLLPGSVFAEIGALPMWAEVSVLGPTPFIESATIPMWIEQSRFESAITATFRGWPMNLKNFALTEFDNFSFNSFARLNGEYLAAGDGGIFALSGADDSGTNIDARVRFASFDLGIQQLKRLEDTFLNYRSDGTLILRIVVDGGQTFEYPLEPTGKTGVYQVRVKTGKGLKVNYLQLEVANFDGADFDLDQIRIKPAILSRSIGGN